jgi:HK97 gp10 family phage protein
LAHIEFLGQDKLIARVARFEKALDPGAETGVKKVAVKIRDSARLKVRKDTGSLMRSIRFGEYARPTGHVHSIRVTAGGYVRNPKTGEIVDYAVHQELGTSNMTGQPYLGPSFQEHSRELMKEIKKVLRV